MKIESCCFNFIGALAVLFFQTLGVIAAPGGVEALEQQPAKTGSLLKAGETSAEAPVPQPGMEGRHAEKVAAMARENFDLLLIGDSITHTLGEYGGKYEPLKAVWQRHFTPRHALNLGYSGARTENIRWNLAHGELESSQSPKVAMLLIGTNDTDDRHYPKVHTAGEVFEGTKAIVELIKKRHPKTKILILRIFPRGGDAEKGTGDGVFHASEKCMETCRRAGELTAQLADEKQVFWLDVNRVFMRADGTINTDLMPHLLHPNTAGAEAWVQAVEPTLARLMGEHPGGVESSAGTRSSK
jgi:lysophospholipase L1-like esterase